MDTSPLGVFDSGLGGLTAVRELMRELPNEDIIYLGDTGRVPYGGRSRETIQRYARQDIRFLLRRGVKAIAAACGTVSTNGLEEVAADFDVPIFGVVGAAAKAAVSATRTGRIGLIGTRASIASTAYDDKLREYLPDAVITKAACPLFVPLVEEGRTDPNDEVLKLIAAEYLEPIRGAGVDTLILGCTHYPLIKDAIANIMGGAVLIDPGAETARLLREFLTERELLGGSGGGCQCFVTDSVEGFERSAKLFLGENMPGRVERVTIDE